MWIGGSLSLSLPSCYCFSLVLPYLLTTNPSTSFLSLTIPLTYSFLQNQDNCPIISTGIMWTGRRKPKRKCERTWSKLGNGEKAKQPESRKAVHAEPVTTGGRGVPWYALQSPKKWKVKRDKKRGKGLLQLYILHNRQREGYGPGERRRCGDQAKNICTEQTTIHRFLPVSQSLPQISLELRLSLIFLNSVWKMEVTFSFIHLFNIIRTLPWPRPCNLHWGKVNLINVTLSILQELTDG